MPAPVTLDDVARLAGVSRATASRALNGRPGVRPDVRDRVERIAASLSFVANRAARHLASGRSSVIGLVIPTADLRIDPYGASMIHAVGRAANFADQGLMLHLAADEPVRSVQHILRDGLIDGVIVGAVAVGIPWVDELLDGPLPTVLVGRHPTRTDVDSVSVENVESSAAAVEHLFSVGCRRVGTIAGPLDRADGRERLQGYRLAHERRGLALDDSLVVQGDFHREAGKLGAAALLERGIDGLFTANDEMALGALWSFARAGVRVPYDVAVAGFDGTSLNDFVEPTLTSVRQPFDAIAEAAVARLLSRIDGEPGVRQTVIQAVLEPGGSSARSPA